MAYDFGEKNLLGDLVIEMIDYSLKYHEQISKGIEPYASTLRTQVQYLNNLHSDLESKIKNLAKRKPNSEAIFR